MDAGPVKPANKPTETIKPEKAAISEDEAGKSRLGDGETMGTSPPESVEQQRNRGSDAEWAMVRLTRTSLIATAVTAGVAILAAGFTGLQWWETHSGGELQRDQVRAIQTQADAAKMQAAAAAKAADAALAQVEAIGASVGVAQESVGVARSQFSASERNAANQLRPYMQITSVRDGFTVGARPRIQWQARNAGNVPAYNANNEFVVAMLPRSPSVNPWKLLKPQRAPPVTIGPGTQFEGAMQLPTVLTEAHIQSLRAGEIAIYTVGYIEYEGAGRQRHRSHHCGMWFITDDGAVTGEACKSPRDF